MKHITNFANKKVLVLGLAKSGESAARLLDKLGAIVTVNDGKPFEENPAAQSLLEEGIKVVTGGHPLELLDEEFELMVKNPGIRYDNPMVKKALEKEIPVITEVELAYLISDAPIIGITGSNGKTTTTTMIAEVLTAGGQSGLLSGNIGFPASQVATTTTKNDTLVMELSSFQLMGIETFHPEIVVITNLMPTHIDYHGSFENYVAAKWNIQKNMSKSDFLVLNFNQTLAKELAAKTQATVVPFSTTEKVDGAYLEGNMLTFRGEPVMAADELGVPGSHNVENALATIAVAKLRGIENQVIKETLAGFGGVKHRLQYVGEINHVKFYNDSKSTNILATQKALSGFDNSKVILIAGGLDRGNEFDELVPDIQGLKKMVILGESAARVKRAADKAGVSYMDAADVKDATKKAFAEAQAGDIVLLSPANASWDMYPNFEVRGDEFIATFEELKG
ncbi:MULTISPECIES: UDP-N-acetylmuramoyl-L-alanine--D-glutamate ligase [Streptococcus]|jgi:UDP-N-acetylmuramoylalanine--D-glutamate ligase|uniref:UDP-N-acetylmuramoyl-L-alanine--D-glutamate ligase n=1 Tax=Streptococcus TaxID=1301 RepID=UPI0008A89D14|nr:MULTISPECIES: UDP-N-acetylmuramoyl-L-alanine--D-glutamate ligase [Streptococcus]KAA9323309.1 UDP-N-acetylmuramoyl-L-alanine--D-glutamate ligase [Streptococcus anginosus]MCW0933339.1 UDP-N-acetylmuramoyl-L-alanine--D-glutamate ligase [Streptococcus anginosus]MCW1037057.1 UDP-N-acetylmuramoyl-L-alanine--D-glutamate ligase [Streptococcus anginosus]MCW1055153.1 UDP-N-acetylmuramoyl-L-alanine--D-glutamate ligase [Streptococcus anginosus]MCW1061828.1 UDP-N-acetylmuramoyl-L-alanine--D-glutamate li